MSRDKIKEEQETPGGRQGGGADGEEEKIEQERSQEEPSGEEDSQSQEDSPEKMDGSEQEPEEGHAGQEKKKGKQDPKDAQIEELQDRLKRQMAEFDNFRKRTEKEKSQMYEIGAKDVIEKILPVVDNFERGLNAAKDSPQDDPFVQGMEMVYKQMMTALEGIGVKPIEAVGNEFDPEFHNAVMHVDDAELGENVVVEELQKGYLYRDSVVRYSMVKVAN